MYHWGCKLNYRSLSYLLRSLIFIILWDFIVFVIINRLRTEFILDFHDGITHVVAGSVTKIQTRLLCPKNGYTKFGRLRKSKFYIMFLSHRIIDRLKIYKIKTLIFTLRERRLGLTKLIYILIFVRNCLL